MYLCLVISYLKPTTSTSRSEILGRNDLPLGYCLLKLKYTDTDKSDLWRPDNYELVIRNNSFFHINAGKHLYLQRYFMAPEISWMDKHICFDILGASIKS